MKIRYLTPFAGRGVATIRAGDEVDVEPKEAKRLIERGLAAPVSEPKAPGGERTKKVSKATAKPPAKAVSRE